MNRIDYYATDETIQALVRQYGEAFEKLGLQRFQLLQALAIDGHNTETPSVATPIQYITQQLNYLDNRARAGVIAAIAQRLWEDT